MNRFLLPLAAFVLLLAVLLVGLKRAPEKSILPSPLIGKAAPHFTLPNLFDTTQPVTTAALQGHWSLVNVWGTWCVECRAEHEVLLQIKQQEIAARRSIASNPVQMDAIRKQVEKRKAAEEAAKAAKKAEWRGLHEVRREYLSADQVGDVLIFDVLGNNYRLMTRVKYNLQRIYVKALLNHREYDRKEWMKWA